MDKGTYKTGKSLRDDQSVAGTVDDVLERWAKARAGQTEESFADALGAVLGTDAGRQVWELDSGPHRRERADEWRANVAEERTTDALGRRSPSEASNPFTDG